MFEEQKPPTNLPVGPDPEDMFAGVEPAQTPRPAEFQAGKPAPAAPPPPTPSSPSSEAEVKAPLIASRKIIMVVGAVVGVLAVAGIAAGVLRFARKAAQSPAASELPASPAEIPLEVPALPEAPAPEAVLETPSPAIDSDSDGLTDEQEGTYGTDTLSPDSDNDGLLDGEEVLTYETDPLSADTDGDTYLDGQEVRAGYNPKGEGRLFTVPSQ